MSTLQEFKFQYTVMKVTATLDARDVQFKMGLRKYKAEISALKHLYVQQQIGGDTQELTLTYSYGHKLKRFRVYADTGEAGFDQAIAALLERRPDIDIRSLPEKEAFAAMGAVNTEKMAAISVPVIITLVVAGMMYPAIRHGFDDGHEDVTVAELAEGKVLDSANLTVSETTLCLDEAIEKTTTQESSKTVRYYIPLVPKGAKCLETTVSVVLETDDLNESDRKELLESPSIDGMHLNIWWEGLGDDERAFFVEEQSLTLADEIVLVEYKAKPGDYKSMVFIGLGVTFFIMVVLSIFMWRKRKS
jgi:hypothetical protein